MKWKLVSVHFEMVLISTQDRWAHPMELLGYTGQVEAHFSPFGDSVDLDAR